MSEITAKLAAAKLNDEKGISDELAAKMFTGLGSHHVAIVDMQVQDRTEGSEGQQIVRLAVSQLEILTGDAAEHARELMRAVYLARQPRGLDQVDSHEEKPDRIIERGKNTLLNGGDSFEYDRPEGTDLTGAVKATVDA